MPRSLVLGNGNVLVTFDNHLQLRDMYYPFVGQEDHTGYDNVHRVGFWVNGQFLWLDDPSWRITIDYEEGTLVGNGYAENYRLGIAVTFHDFVSLTEDIFFRSLEITNLSGEEKEVRVFFHHDFHIYGEKSKDTALYEPDLNSILHYRGRRYFLVGGQWGSGEQSNQYTMGEKALLFGHEGEGMGMDEYTVGKSKYHEKEGTFRDAEDGTLQKNPIDQGSVDSTVRFSIHISPGKTKQLFLWIAFGKTYQSVLKKNEHIREVGAERIRNHVRGYWREWLATFSGDISSLPSSVQHLFQKSLLILRTQIDNRGAILAANDSDVMATNRDNYSYMWPRDASLCAMTLAKVGFEEPCRNFFQFCEEIITPEGYFLHKYNPDGSLGSSWHPKIVNGEKRLPIQEDESALVLVALDQYFSSFHSLEVIQRFFPTLILPLGNWLQSYVDPSFSLPLPSYDLWEQSWATSSYTASCVYAGLLAAARLSEATGHQQSADSFRESATCLQTSIANHLFSSEQNRFLRSIEIRDGVITKKDDGIDSSLVFLWKMGVFAPDDPRIQSTMKVIHETLTIPGNIGGLARFARDPYQFDHQLSYERYTGNPWIITTLWEAEYRIKMAKTKDDLAEAEKTLLWATERASSAGMLPEQVHPETGEHLFVSPLTWSHATFIDTVLAFAEKAKKLKK
ncbi:glycoside hydrolase family 15 protein [Candidatus Peregrinibacteria bacterium]|nr:MAG: glycoside hydrolase family 15 protein [Candidatus Peregrinibacteria bacterium]